MLCNWFLVVPHFCENSLELAEMGELDYFSAGVGLYAFLLSIKVESVVRFFFKLLVHGDPVVLTGLVDLSCLLPMGTTDFSVTGKIRKQ